MSEATAVAHPNIALIKYWGKRERALNLPAAGSLSVTLGPFRSRTRVRFGAEQNRVHLDARDVSAEPAGQKVLRFIDLVRALTPTTLGPVEVVSDNDFPTAAGLASSSSGSRRWRSRRRARQGSRHRPPSSARWPGGAQAPLLAASSVAWRACTPAHARTAPTRTRSPCYQPITGISGWSSR